MMAGELVLSFGIQKLWDLLSQECEQFQGVKDQVTELKRALNLLSSFLKDADAKKHTRWVVKNCVEEIKDIVYDAEDIIETYLLKEELGETSGIKKRIRRLAWIIPDRREITSDMRGISTRISKVICDMKDFGVQQIIIADGMDSQPLQERQREMRQEFAGKYESELVGLEANVKKLVGYLVEENDVQVVSITGMGGLGKTTLARQVFNHDMVKNKFDGLAWVCVSQVFNRKNVWQTILQKLTPKEKKDEILHMTEATLQEELFRLLKTSKSLIVFDDIWEEEHWDLINLIFPEKGWKVLLTSRKEIVTTRRNTINFKTECLTTEDSWTLFKMIALPRKDASELEKIDEEMEVMGKQMIKHCGGLPLAIRVLGGLLAAKYTVHDWKRVSENIGSRILEGTNLNDNNIGSVNRVLSTSFEELPSNLKNCFLYLAHFPEDYQISVNKLSYYWAAEGILKYQDGETILDVGDVYIEELVRRNMVISERDVKTLRFETCHLHDMMRENCLSKAKEDNFLQIVGICSQAAHSQTRSTSRRFVSQNPTTLHVERDINNSKVRSLVVVSKDGESWELSSLSFARLQLLRVLDFSKAKFEGEELPYSIGKLIHLRYLNLEDAWVSHVPSSLRNLKLLIYLNLDVSFFVKGIYVPNVLMGMKELRYLHLPVEMHEKTKLELSNLEYLETLKNFSTKNSSLDDLRRMSRLRILSIKLIRETSIETLSASIGGLRHLEDLHIVDLASFARKTEMGFIVNFVHLKHLSLSICMPSLPKPLPSHLTTLTLHGCRLEEDPMPILDKLPQLKEVTLLWNAFSGRRMDCSAGGFPQLQKLKFLQLDLLEEWRVEEGSMPLLHTLEIYDCKKLKELPDGLRFITSLKDLTSYDMREKWKERLSEGGEDYYKVQHIPSVNIGIEYIIGDYVPGDGRDFITVELCGDYFLVALADFKKATEEWHMAYNHTCWRAKEKV